MTGVQKGLWFDKIIKLSDMKFKYWSTSNFYPNNEYLCFLKLLIGTRWHIAQIKCVVALEWRKYKYCSERAFSVEKKYENKSDVIID